MLTRHQAAEMLASFDRVLILCHRNPDGDTLGSGFALCRAFLNQGKKARVFCNDPIPVQSTVPEVVVGHGGNVGCVSADSVCIIGVGGQGEADLLLAGEAVCRCGFSPCRIQGRQQKAGQNHNDRNND